MLKARAQKLQQRFVDSGITGSIHAHDREGVHQAIVRMLSGDPYYTLGVKQVEDAGKVKLTAEQISPIVAASLGISIERFNREGAGYIAPDLTIDRLNQMLDWIDAAIARSHSIALATAHPGSLLKFYLRLEDYISTKGGELFRSTKPLEVGRFLWVDSVRSVLVLSDMGSLLHTHDSGPMTKLLDQSARPGLVISDHGFAGAAINAGIKTVGLHDVDDPAIPVAEYLGAGVLPVPMNDNQLNLKTDGALQALIASR